MIAPVNVAAPVAGGVTAIGGNSLGAVGSLNAAFYSQGSTLSAPVNGPVYRVLTGPSPVNLPQSSAAIAGRSVVTAQSSAQIAARSAQIAARSAEIARQGLSPINPTAASIVANPVATPVAASPAAKIAAAGGRVGGVLGALALAAALPGAVAQAWSDAAQLAKLAYASGQNVDVGNLIPALATPLTAPFALAGLAGQTHTHPALARTLVR